MMPTANVTIAYVNQPREGKKYGSIKTKDGQLYSVKPSDLGLFEQGRQYEIEYAFDASGKYRNFVRLMAPPKPDSDRERMIFVTGVVGRAMGSGKFELADIDALAQAADGAFAHLTEEVPEPPHDDEVPF